ncbi:MAG: hypothetical protein IJW77_10435 [Clostridia bacterium]|nr:hypothetical protein [Clostridia bacterium]
MKKTIFAAAAVMLVVLSACADAGNDAVSESVDTAGTETVAVTEAEPAVLYPREAVDYGGKVFTFLNCEDVLWDGTFHILDYEQESGDTIEDAVYNRARNAEERFNIALTVEKLPFGELAPNLNKIVMAGESLYDAAYIPLSTSPAPLLGKNGLNLYDIDSLHLEDDWWHQVFIKEATLFGDTLYAMPDYCNLMGYTRVATLVFNKKLMETHDLAVPYDLVRDGKWTLDKMREYMAQVVNLNGDASFADTAKTTNAVYGYGAQHEGDLFSLMVSSGESLIVYDDNGYPKVREDLTALENVYSKLAEVLGTDGFGMMKNGDSYTGDGSAADLFSAGRLLFRNISIGVCASAIFRNLDFEYGVLPNPKIDETQEAYHSAISEYTLSLVVPITAADPEMTGNVINYMSYLGKTEIIPELQTALCYKGMRDNDSIEMMDMIMNSVYLDLGYVQSWTTDITKRMAGDIMNNKLNVVSTVEKQQKKISNTIEKAISDMTSTIE